MRRVDFAIVLSRPLRFRMIMHSNTQFLQYMDDGFSESPSELKLIAFAL